jgi:hypothetical protein
MTEDLLSGDFNVEQEKPPFEETRLYKTGTNLMFMGSRLALAFIISQGIYYMFCSVNGLVEYSELATNGRNMLALGLFLTLLTMGVQEDVRYETED